jgi:formylglycine-generating enzyme required for sulfatase activity
MIPKSIRCVISVIFLVVIVLFSGALPAKAAASLFKPANFVLIRSGEFTMGSPEGEVNHQDNETQHQVRVSNFFISKFAVTVAEFRKFVEATGYRTDAENIGSSIIVSNGEVKAADGVNWRDGMSGSVRPQSEENHPVVSVTWNDAMAYCAWLSAKTGKRFRLPTEAEREYACRAGSHSPFNTGENITTSQANYDGNYPYNNNPTGEFRQNTVAVNSFAPNAFGLYNMHGNVWEWCSDWYSETYYGECKTKGTAINPVGPATGSSRVLRGGSWHANATRCRSAFRDIVVPDIRICSVGFRLVVVP